MNNEDWTPKELERLRAARTEAAPPPDLEDTTVTALRRRGLLSGRRSKRARTSVFRGKGLGTAALIAAAAALAIVASWSVLHKPAAPLAPSGSPKFALLLYAGVDPAPGAPDRRHEEYAQWARDLSARGVAITGEELADDTRQLGAPASTSPELPRGFFVVSAADFDAAQRIASSCPHLRYGGRIVIKRVVS